jgi:hypothetical protein
MQSDTIVGHWAAMFIVALGIGILASPAAAKSAYGECLVALGMYERAEPLLLESCETITTRPCGYQLSSRDAHRRLTALYESWGKPEKAAEYRSMLGEEAEDDVPPDEN